MSNQYTDRQNLTLTGTGTSSEMRLTGGSYFAAASGHFHGGTAKFQIKLGNGTSWFDAGTASNFNADGGAQVAAAGLGRWNVIGTSTTSVIYTSVQYLNS